MGLDRHQPGTGRRGGDTGLVAGLADEAVLTPDELEAASDSAVLNPHQNTFIRIRGRRRTLSRGVTTLGRGLALTADGSDRITREVVSSVFDDGVEQRVTSLTSTTASLRLRDDIVSDWSNRRIRYRLPLELVLNNLFNGDVDITLEIRFACTTKATTASWRWPLATTRTPTSTSSRPCGRCCPSCWSGPPTKPNIPDAWVRGGQEKSVGLVSRPRSGN